MRVVVLAIVLALLSLGLGPARAAQPACHGPTSACFNEWGSQEGSSSCQHGQPRYSDQRALVLTVEEERAVHVVNASSSCLVYDHGDEQGSRHAMGASYARHDRAGGKSTLGVEWSKAAHADEAEATTDCRVEAAALRLPGQDDLRASQPCPANLGPVLLLPGPQRPPVVHLP